MAASASLSATTKLVAVFLVSSILFLASLILNFPRLPFHGQSGQKLLDDARISRSQLWPYNSTVASAAGTTEDFRLGDTSAFVFRVQTYSPGSDPYRDCRFRETERFSRKRQIVLPDREQFLITPNQPKLKAVASERLRPPFLLVINYPTDAQTRSKVRSTMASTRSAKLQLNVLSLFVLDSAHFSEELQQEAAKHNDLLVLPAANYPIVRSVTWLCNDEFNVIQSFQAAIFIGAPGKFVSIALLRTLESVLQSESVVDGDPSLFGGLDCHDYESVPEEMSSSSLLTVTSISCAMSAFYCSSRLMVMSPHVAESIVDSSWNTPLLSHEASFIGLSLEAADIRFTALVLNSYSVGRYARRSKNTASKIDWVPAL